MKGCGVYFSAKFSWTSPLSNRKVPSLFSGRTETAAIVKRKEQDGSFPVLAWCCQPFDHEMRFNLLE